MVKSLELAPWILARMDCTETAGVTPSVKTAKKEKTKRTKASASGVFSPNWLYEKVNRLENLVLRLNLSLLISWRLFLMKKSKDANWPSGGVHLDFRTWSVSKVSSFEMLESSSLSWKKAFNWTREQNLSPYWELIFLNRKVVNFLLW